MQILRRLRNIGGYSLHLVIPPEVKEGFGLNAGDQVLVDIGEYSVTLTFPKAEQEELAQAS